MGPGSYSPERADTVTKTKMVNINMGTSPSRASFIKKEVEIGPGQYDDGKNFGTDTKSFTIGEKRQIRAVETMGPGAYSPERADTLIKTKMANVNMGSSPARAQTRIESHGGPGQYDDRNYEISKSSKSFIIGEKRESRIEQTMGPGSYDIDRADR